MTVDTCLKFETVREENVLQHLTFRGYTVVEQLSTFQDAVTYVARDNREPDSGYCLVRVLPLKKCDEPVLELFQPAPTISASAKLLCGFEVGGYSYLIREYIFGQPLAWEIPQLGWNETQVINLLRPILRTLAQCHQEGAIHGNLHPHNLIRRSDGRLILTDFTGNQGCYHQTIRRHKVGLKSNILGLLEHPAYAAPEQWRGCHHPSSDIYALGMLGLQFLLGRQSWTSEAQLNQLLSKLPCQSLVSFLKRMVNIVPEQRYGNADMALFALEHLQLGHPLQQHHTSVGQEPQKQDFNLLEESFTVNLEPWQMQPGHHQLSQAESIFLKSETLVKSEALVKNETLTNCSSIDSSAVSSIATLSKSSSDLGTFLVVKSRPVATPTTTPTPTIETAKSSESSAICLAPKSVQPETMETLTLSPVMLATVSIADLAQPNISQMAKASALPVNGKASQETLLLAPELPREPSPSNVSNFKWTPAMAAMTASVGSVLLYHVWSSSQQEVTPAIDISYPAVRDEDSIQADQAVTPINVPTVTTDFGRVPSFSQPGTPTVE